LCEKEWLCVLAHKAFPETVKSSIANMKKINQRIFFPKLLLTKYFPGKFYINPFIAILESLVCLDQHGKRLAGEQYSYQATIFMVFLT
jgi:hypothetical protein